MRVILLKDVAKIGRRFDVCEVPSGHALNFLIPRKLAEPATPESLRKLNVEKAKKTILRGRHDESFLAALKDLEVKPVTLSVSANEQGHLFKGLHEKDVQEALKKEGYEVDAKEIVLSAPIKELGEHRVTLRSGEHEGSFTLTVTRS